MARVGKPDRNFPAISKIVQEIEKVQARINADKNLEADLQRKLDETLSAEFVRLLRKNQLTPQITQQLNQIVSPVMPSGSRQFQTFDESEDDPNEQEYSE